MDRFDFFAPLPRIEPGAVNFTSVLLTSVDVGAEDTVLDLNAGAGDRAVWMARSRCRKVIALNEDERYTEKLKQQAADGGADAFLSAVTGNLMELPFDDGQFKLILAEWAATAHGLRASLENWQRYLSPDGYLALSYPGVKNKDAPVEARGPLELRMAEPMDTLKNYHKIIAECGYELCFQLPLPEEAWEYYYADALRRIWALTGDKTEAITDPVLKSIHAEAQWYRRVGRGRVFLQGFLLKKIA